MPFKIQMEFDLHEDFKADYQNKRKKTPTLKNVLIKLIRQ